MDVHLTNGSSQAWLRWQTSSHSLFYSGWTLKHLYAHVNYPEVPALFVAPKCLICLTSFPLNQCSFWIWFERSIAFGFKLLAYSNFRQCKSIFNVFTCTCFTGLLSIIKVFTFHIVSSIILKKGFPSPIYEDLWALFSQARKILHEINCYLVYNVTYEW